MNTAPDIKGNSRTVSSPQWAPHKALSALLEKHQTHRYLKPISDHSLIAFKQLNARVLADGREVILDSGCGTGESTHHLVRSHPHALVIGIDQSASRLKKAQTLYAAASNLIFCRADCVDIWRLAKAAAWPVSHHYLLYPNPWPKSKHLLRRWHAHPVFGDLLALGGRLELRSNWRVYVEEFALAIKRYTQASCEVEEIKPLFSMTPFERKYMASGHPLYRIIIGLKTHQAS